MNIKKATVLLRGSKSSGTAFNLFKKKVRSSNCKR